MPTFSTALSRRRVVPRLTHILAGVAAVAVLTAPAAAYYEDIDRGTPQERSTFHYELTRALARAAGLSPADAELLAVANAAVDLETFSSLAGGPTVVVTGTDRMQEVTAKHFHYPRRGKENAESPAWTFPGGRDTCAYFSQTQDPCAGDGSEVGTLERWAIWAVGVPAVTPAVAAAVAPASPEAVQGGTLLALAVYLHSLADSYSHEKCMEVTHTRKHALSPPACTAEYWHGLAEYGSSAAGVSFTREAARAVFHELAVVASLHGATPAWSEDEAAAFIETWAGSDDAATRRDLADEAYAELTECTLACTATVPGAAVQGEEVAFAAHVVATGCVAAPSLEWRFGDGSAPATEAGSTHVYTSPGSYAWTLEAHSGETSCTTSGSTTVTAPPAAATYLVPSVAHAPGSAGTNWRTDVAAVNRSASEAALTLSFLDYGTGAPTTVALSLPAGATVEWRDILVSVFAVDPASSRKGTLRVDSTARLAIASRTYNQESETRTYGQYYPALLVEDAVAAGQTGVLPQLKKSSAFRTNIGVVNLGTSSCTVAITLFEASGAKVGSTRALTVEAGRWRQQDDIFAATGAGSRDIAYATVEGTTPGARFWACASVIDNQTGDPTTVPVVVP